MVPRTRSFGWPGSNQSMRQCVTFGMAVIASLHVVPANTPAAEGDAGSAERRFREEYPSAAERLQTAMEDTTGRGRYLYTRDPFNRKQKDRESMKWVEFEFYKAGPAIRLDRKFPPEMVRASEGRYADSMSLVQTPGFCFAVANPRTPRARLTETSKQPAGRIRTQLALFWRDFYPSLYQWAERPIAEWLKDDGLKVQGVREVEQSHLVRVDFTYDGRGWFSTDKPQDFQCHGYWMLDPQRDWAVRETWYQDRYTTQPGKSFGDEEHLTITFQSLSQQTVAPQRISLVHRRLDSKGRDYKELERKELEFEEIRPERVEASYFTPEALGVEDPRRRGISWFLVLNAILLAVLIAIVAYRRWRRTETWNAGFFL